MLQDSKQFSRIPHIPSKSSRRSGRSLFRRHAPLRQHKTCPTTPAKAALPTLKPQICKTSYSNSVDGYRFGWYLRLQRQQHRRRRPKVSSAVGVK